MHRIPRPSAEARAFGRHTYRPLVAAAQASVAALARVGYGGKIGIYNSSGWVDLVGDVVGWTG